MNPLNIYQKLLSIQKHVNGLAKDKKSFSYSYVTGDKVLGIIKPLMNDLGLILKQEVTSIENTRQDYDTAKGHKSEILSKVMMKFTWIDTDSGEKDENVFGANGQNDWEKGLGSALTYAERYFLLKYFHIATDEDDIDNDKRETSEPVKKNEAKAEPKQTEVKSLPILLPGGKQWKGTVEKLAAGSVNIEQVKQYFQLTAQHADQLMGEALDLVPATT